MDAVQDGKTGLLFEAGNVFELQERLRLLLGDAALREQSFGCVEGLTVDEIKQRYPEAWAGWLRFDENYRMPEGETTRQFHARVMDAMNRLAATHRGETIVVVTHGGALDMVYRTVGNDWVHRTRYGNGEQARVTVFGLH